MAWGADHTLPRTVSSDTRLRIPFFYRWMAQAFPERRMASGPDRSFLFRCEDANWLWGLHFVQWDIGEWEIEFLGELDESLALKRREVDTVRIDELRTYLESKGMRLRKVWAKLPAVN